MRTLRRIVGGTKGFKYKVEDIQFTGLGKTNSFAHLIGCAKTKMRVRKGIGFSYSKDGKEFFPIVEAEYYNLLNNYKNNSVVVKRKKKLKEPTLGDMFDFTTHFIERLKERFINNEDSAPQVMNYIYQNGFVIDPVIVMRYRPDITEDGNMVIYEPDLRAVVIAKHNETDLKLITTYPADGGWFENLWRNYKHDEHTKLKSYAKGLCDA